MAEVLITLAIIGVVAALTIPTVVKNYQKTQLKTALKKNWSVMTQVLNQTMFEMGGKVNCYYGVNGDLGTHDDCDKFFTEFLKKFKVIKTCNVDVLEEGCQPKYTSFASEDASICGLFRKDPFFKNKTYVLSDGTIITLYSPNGTDWALGTFTVDVNGKVPPNKGGWDLFQFSIAFDGKKYYFKDNITGCIKTEKGGVPVPIDGSDLFSRYSQLDNW